MLIDSSGRVGINQGSPSAVLEVKGQTGVASTALITHGLVQFKTTHNDSSELRHQFNMGGASDAGSYVIKQGDASTNGIILAAGDDSYIANNLGIGQASPSYKLDVSGTGRFTGALTTANILLGAGSNLYLDGGSNTYIKQTSGDVIGIFTGGNNRMTIDSGGRVGINNSLPEELLHIKSSANSATPVIRLENTNAGVYAPQINLYNNSSSPADNDYLGQIDFEGKDSAGNRTEYARIIASTADVTATIEDGILDFDVFYNGTLTNALRIRGMGGGAYVGIGETNPDEKLEVNGNVKINNSIIFGGQNMKIVGNTSTPALELRGGVSGQVRVYCDETLRWTFDDGGDLSSPSNHISTGGKMSVGSGTEAQPGYQLGSSNDGFFHDGGIKVVVNNAVDFLMADGGTFHADADVVAYSTTISDERLKDDVKTIDSALDKVKRLRGVEYVWSHGSKKGQKDIGVIAQETEKVIPEIVQEKEMPLWSAKDPEVSGKYKMVDYEKLTAVLIESVKEQQKQIDELKSELQELKDGSSR